MSTATPVEANKALVREGIAAIFNRGDWSAAEEHYAEDMVVHAPPQPPFRGRESFKSLFTLLRTAFPDLRMEIEDLFAAGDRVAVRWTMHGTHRGDYAGFPPTGIKVAVQEILIFRFVDGKVQEIWHVPNIMETLQQLGMPAGAPPRAIILLMGLTQRIGRLLPKRSVRR